jgi:hypothetical protein
MLIFKDFQAMVENHLGKKNKCIQKDNGDEFFFNLSRAIVKQNTFNNNSLHDIACNMMVL